MLKGKTHCLTTRVRVRGGFLKSDSPNTHSTFDQLFAPCVTSLDSFFFCFRKYNNHNQRATSPKSPERCRDKDCEEFSCAIPFHTLEDPELVTKSWLLCICLPYTWLLSSHWHKSASNFHNFFGKKTKTGWEGCYCTTIIQGTVSIQFKKLFSIRSSMKMDALHTVHMEWIRRGLWRQGWAERPTSKKLKEALDKTQIHNISTPSRIYQFRDNKSNLTVLRQTGCLGMC